MEKIKKFLLLIILFGVPLYGADWASQRHLYSKSMLEFLPKDKQMYSPVVGMSLLEGALGEKIYQQGEDPAFSTDQGELARSLLHSLDGNLRRTARPGNPFFSISPEEFGALVKADSEGIKIRDFMQSDLGKAWRERHTLKGKDPKKFVQRLNKIGGILERMEPAEKAPILSMFAAAMSQKHEDLAEYIKGLTGQEVKPEKIVLEEFPSPESIDIETLIVMLISGQMHIYQHLKSREQLYVDYKGVERIPICFEQSLWGLINMLLYNPSTQRLDLAVLPADITVNANFEKFIQMYNNPSELNYYQNAKNDFMDLVFAVKGVEYVRDGFEIKSNPQNILVLMNYLFGLDVRTFEELAMRLSSKTRIVKMLPQKDEIGKEDVFVIDIDIQDPSVKYAILSEIVLGNGHTQMEFNGNMSRRMLPYLRNIIDYEMKNPEMPLGQLSTYLVNKLLRETDEKVQEVGFKDKDDFLNQLLDLPSFRAEYLDMPPDVFDALQTETLTRIVRDLPENEIHYDYIQEAVRRDDKELLNILLRKGKINKLLSEAVIQNNIDLAKKLLSIGADPWYAARNALDVGNPEMIVLLLDLGSINELRRKNRLRPFNLQKYRLLLDALVDPLVKQNNQAMIQKLLDGPLSLQAVLRYLNESDKEMAQFLVNYIARSNLDESEKEDLLKQYLEKFPNLATG